MNTNIFGVEGRYHACVMGFSGNDSVTWGFDVEEKPGRDIFTVKFANEMLDFANSEFKKGCPKGYNKEAYRTDIPFTWIEYDMSDYKKVIGCDGENYVPCSKKKVGRYDKKKNNLRIYVDGIPVYENDNGTICRDSVAIMDCDGDMC